MRARRNFETEEESVDQKRLLLPPVEEEAPVRPERLLRRRENRLAWRIGLDREALGLELDDPNASGRTRRRLRARGELDGRIRRDEDDLAQHVPGRGGRFGDAAGKRPFHETETRERRRSLENRHVGAVVDARPLSGGRAYGRAFEMKRRRVARLDLGSDRRGHARWGRQVP